MIALERLVDTTVAAAAVMTDQHNATAAAQPERKLGRTQLDVAVRVDMRKRGNVLRYRAAALGPDGRRLVKRSHMTVRNRRALRALVVSAET